MNARFAIRSATLAAVALVAAVGTPAAHAADDDATGLSWSCDRDGAPSHREIAAAFGFDNWWFARNLQPALYIELRRECDGRRDRVVYVAPRQERHERIARGGLG